ncbi:MAG: phytanoyl-CoA dioxygenase family protein [Planctomycetota bacterium]
MDRDLYEQQVAGRGFAIIENVISKDDVLSLRDAIASIPDSEEVRRKSNVFGIRNLLEICSPCRELAASAEIRSLVSPILGEKCFAVRGTFFDKVPGANWNLRWHQDSVIAVTKKIDVPGFHAWSTKAGVVQARPPHEILQRMLAIRIHLDDCTAANGALRALAGSHQQRWERDDLSIAKGKYEMLTCEVAVGGVLAMRPLLLHASSASEIPEHRRVIHIEYACDDLPGGLEWQTKIA